MSRKEAEFSRSSLASLNSPKFNSTSLSFVSDPSSFLRKKLPLESIEQISSSKGKSERNGMPRERPERQRVGTIILLTTSRARYVYGVEDFG
jgi:hypothetical protein